MLYRHRLTGQAPRLIVGYMDYFDVEIYRREMFPPCAPRDRGPNIPGWQIQLKRIAQIKPKNWNEDPYLLCVLLSLAQLQEYHREESHPPIHLVSALLANPCAFFHWTPSSFMEVTSDFVSRAEG